MPIVIIGAGLAGLRTAAELRERDYSGRIIIVGAESHPPYDRPPLSSKLLSDPDPVWLADDLSIDWPAVADEVHLGVTATGLSLGQVSTVHTGAGDFEASHVVIATGASAINPWPGTLTLTTLDDAADIRRALEGGPRRVTIIGAGWVGVELAHVISRAGHEVSLVELSDHPLSDHVGEASAHLRPWLDHIDLHTSTTVTGVSAEGQGSVVHTSGGDIHADVVITSVGVRPNTDWLAGTGLPRDGRGFIPVDASGAVETPTGSVWAVGDVATHDHPVFGTVVGGHWFSALRDPAQVAEGILDEESSPRGAPEVFSDQGEHHVEVLGSLSGSQTVLRGEVASGSWVLFHLREGLLVGAVVANSPRDTSSIRRALSRPEPLAITAEELADVGTPLRRLLKR